MHLRKVDECVSVRHGARCWCKSFKPEDGDGAHARWVIPAREHARTVEESEAPGDVCVRSMTPTGYVPHRPVVRDEDGRCFLCSPEPWPRPWRDARARIRQAISDSQAGTSHEDAEPDGCDECGHLPISHDEAQGCTFCACRVGEAVLPPPVPAPLPVYLVTYTVAGGQEYDVAVPGDASVMAVDGVLKIYHRQQPVLAITRMQTHPLLKEGEAHDPEAEDHRH